MADHYNVLFLCTGNSARSIMAEAILNHKGKGKFTAYSAGSHPTGQPRPEALQQIESAGLSTAGLRSKSWDEFSAPDAPKLDFVFTVCDNAAKEQCPYWPGQPMTAHWGIADPAAVKGTPEEIARAFRDAFTVLDRRIGLFLSLPLATLETYGHQARNRPDRPVVGGNGEKESVVFSGSLSDGMDLRRHGVRRGSGLACSRSRAVPEPLQRRHDFNPNRSGTDPDDVPAVHAGPLRRTPRGVPQQARAGPVAGAELAHRAGPDVRAGSGVPARLPGIYGRAHHDRTRTVHRHGHRVERTGEGRHTIRSWAGGVQLSVPGLLLLGLLLGVHHGSAGLVRSARSRGQHLHRRDRKKRLHLSGYPFYRRVPDAHSAGPCQGPRVVRPELRAASRPADADRSVVHHRGDVFSQRQLHRASASGRSQDRHTALDLLRGDVPGVVLHGPEAWRRLLEDDDARVHRGLKQLRVGHRRCRVGVRHQLRRCVRRCDRPAG